MSRGLSGRWWTGVLAVLAVVVATAQQVQAPSASARKVLQEYCKIDAGGAAFTSDGWNKLREFFVRPAAPDPTKFVVIRDYVVSQPKVEGGVAELFVEYTYLGELDRDGRYGRLPGMLASTSMPTKVRLTYKLESGQQSGTTGNLQGTSASRLWRIDAPNAVEPHVSLEAAIDYVAKLRDTAVSDTAKRRAEASLAALRRQQ